MNNNKGKAEYLNVYIPPDFKEVYGKFISLCEKNTLDKSKILRKLITGFVEKNESVRLNFEDTSTSENRDAARENQGVSVAS